MKIIGVKPYRFVPDGQTEPISGFTVWAVEDIEQGKGVGMQPVKLGMNSERYEQMIGANGGIEKLIGQQVDVSYDRYGKPVSLSLVKG